MGLFTPKYPKSDTPGATAQPTRRSRRSSRSSGTSSTPTQSGLTTDQMRGLSAQSGVTVDIRGNTAKITVNEWDTHARITSQVYTKQSDGSWSAA